MNEYILKHFRKRIFLSICNQLSYKWTLEMYGPCEPDIRNRGVRMVGGTGLGVLGVQTSRNKVRVVLELFLNDYLPPKVSFSCYVRYFLHPLR